MLYLDYSRKRGRVDTEPLRRARESGCHRFFEAMNEVAYLRFPGVLTIAEESTAWPSVSRPTYLGGLGFSPEVDMGWMNDTLHYSPGPRFPALRAQ